MGVRGLTSYIAKNAEKYLEPYELHDCDLVIDGDSLASNLYSWHSQCNSAFGGDYDQYYRCVVTFFAMLKQCNVTPYVLLDGGYEKKKLETVRHRLRSKIGAVKHINPFRCIPLFPLMLREVFVEAVKTTGCQLMRCLFEADDEVSVLARKLNCPVLSYDSDFYIHNVMYIPSITLSLRVHKRKTPKKNRRKLPEDGEKPGGYCYLDCCVYSIANLVRNELDHDMLPLFATLLGNDYINGRLFRKFYANVSLKHIGKNNSQQQRRIIGLLRWLQHETVDSAIAKVLGRFEKHKRTWMLRQIDAAMGGYNRENSRAFAFFELNRNSGERSIDNITGFINESIDLEDKEIFEDSEHSSQETSSEDESVDADEVEDEDKLEDEDEIVSEIDEENSSLEDVDDTIETSDSFEPPQWVLQKILTAKLPRFVVDLLHLKLYVNSPQIENFMLNDSNEIALPILQLIFTLLHHPEPCQFQYLTRVHKISNVHYKKIVSISLESQFDPTGPKNFRIFEKIFDDFGCKLDLIDCLPEQFKLFVLAMVYLSEKNSTVTPPFMHSLLIGLLLLSKADEDIQPVTRDPRVLQKKYRSVLETVATESKPIVKEREEIIDNINVADMIQSITTEDSVFFLRNVLPLFQISDKIREKHTDFSSTIVHTFAEFQATIFNLNCLNTLLNEPFERIVVSKVFNGTFLYNMYVNLRDRPNIEHYIRHYVFRDCERYYHLYANILGICKSAILCLKNVTSDKSKKAKASRNYRRNRRKQQKLKTVGSQEAKIAENAFIDVETDEFECDGNVEFDENNKFAKLLNCSKTL